ncbi:hypothetical protein Ae168Ps1_5638 [Pseudonocardia sp. Ae168_Ps1]|nr:hypothetical protein Ae168Ps1_5638 [Pseudonocardia sp. Ae168_Ps1]OLL77315.1 hypothetical protein Ae150APs1_5693c [Pseudonocardia sp. Ae150A_Ps1]OLL88575.1 hypothetical protein Ae263Ps1_5630 [Pseudonocardia sp. Ae263_Ps1]OLL91404.1 hypothetical protein Ae356Ps1_1301c [Pseudonocardia sp. Ae356_Ps1]
MPGAGRRHAPSPNGAIQSGTFRTDRAGLTIWITRTGTLTSQILLRVTPASEPVTGGAVMRNRGW